MKQLLKLRKMITYKKWHYDFLLEFSENLLTKKNYKNDLNFFTKKSRIPKNLIYLKSFAFAYYYYDDIEDIILLYCYILSEFNTINVNQFYNLINYLQSNNIYNINSDILYNVYDLAINNNNHLQNKSNKLNLNNFLKIII